MLIVVNFLSVTYRYICNRHMTVTDMTVTIINCYRNKGLAVRDATLLIPFSTLIRMVMLPEAHSDVFDGY